MLVQDALIIVTPLSFFELELMGFKVLAKYAIFLVSFSLCKESLSNQKHA